MHISYYGKQYAIPDRFKAYAEQKLAGLERLVPELLEFRLNITLDHHHRKGEIYTVHAIARGGTTRLNAMVTAADPYSGVDLLIEKLENQITHERGKQRNTRRRFARLLSPRNMYAVSRKQISRLGGHSRRAFGRVFRRKNQSGDDERYS